MTEKDKKITEVNITDNIGECLGDCLNGNCSLERKPSGYVEIHEKTKDGQTKLVGKSNLVLYSGREHLTQKIFNVANTEIPQALSEYIYWFGAGSGGVVESSPFVPIYPVNSDIGLNTDIVINPGDASCGDLRDGGYYKHRFDSVIYQQDESNDSRYLVAVIQITLDEQDCNDQVLSEAGLFTAASSAAGYSGNFNIFARVTFPSLSKDSSRVFVFSWFLYF